MNSGPEIFPATPAGLATAALALQYGRLVAFSTETVYGLGADATNDRAVAAIFAAKGRPQFNPLIVHIARREQVAALALPGQDAQTLMQTFWPGPLTLILPRRADSPTSLLCSAGLATLAVRCPDHPLALELIGKAGIPVAAPSANRSGQISPSCAGHVAASFRDHPHPDFAGILDGGNCPIGVESTILDLSGQEPILLRPGAILREDIEKALDRAIRTGNGNADRPNAPGQLASHYAPAAPLRINVLDPKPGEAYLAFGPDRAAAARLNLSPAGNFNEAAANLFAFLHELDAQKPEGIAVAPIPETGLGVAINDRLRRAAHNNRAPR